MIGVQWKVKYEGYCCVTMVLQQRIDLVFMPVRTLSVARAGAWQLSVGAVSSSQARMYPAAMADPLACA